MRSLKRLGLPALLGWATVTACGGMDPDALEPEALRDATVTLLPGHCAGVIVEDGRHLLTAAHCVAPMAQRIEVELRDGTRMGGHALRIDPGQDIALFQLDSAAPVTPLPIALEMPTPGEPLLFAGRNDRPGGLQAVWLEKLGRCPSLPEVPQALFTTLHGEKGDSGAPVVDAQMRVVGLVHGGAACSIAAPTSAFAPLVRQFAEDDVLASQ
ncbi:S1 family peptidase [Stigmatella aurantiaca]|uniref:Trypsin, putative n=1 Tax=Stigmatella aurantiaca (strain DW4/3-1) TaxID=378806 RepID=Q095G1_STIAD|nr:serine protease [Stigmatella aurantiaca]ADO74311.1 Trypsin-like serine protease [Stigmatella aurantiaca DW4/3-1]EAU67401.1 trypsin, putative [Stigmatella aurantiaca DW4/3-1]